MIFIGTMNLARTRDRGDFYCPSCESMQGYRLRAKRPWLTLYFIPVVPIGSVELVINCDRCRSNWDETVLQVNAESHHLLMESQVKHEIFRSMILFVLTDGFMEPNEVEPLRKLASRIFQKEVSREELGRLCSMSEQSGVPAENYLETVYQNWNTAQRTLAIQAMFLGASLRGELGDERTRLLMKLRNRAGLTEADFQSLIEQCLQWNEA